MKGTASLIYILKTDEMDINEDIFNMLPSGRQSRIKSAFKKEKALGLYAASLLLSYALSDYGKKLSDIKISETGKPYVEGMPYFNVSHSGKYVVAAVASTEIGIDIQEKKPISDAAAKMFLGTDADFNLASSDKYYHSYVWTRKEAFLKCTGSGWNAKGEREVSVTGNIAEYGGSCYFLSDYFFDDNYFLTICEKDTHTDFEIKELDKHELELFFGTN